MIWQWLTLTTIFLWGYVAMASVPEPWTPVKAQINKNELSVSVWGRTYRFLNSPLPSSVTTLGSEILAAPIRLV
ncbi:MAG: hypothetical protein NZ937_04975, partial [Armatimonadetes bacterium]|nr:hypothetical protein [Armatimonadota bacterium]